MSVPIETREFKLSFRDTTTGLWTEDDACGLLSGVTLDDMDFTSMEEADAVQALEVGESCSFSNCKTTRTK